MDAKLLYNHSTKYDLSKPHQRTCSPLYDLSKPHQQTCSLHYDLSIPNQRTCSPLCDLSKPHQQTCSLLYDLSIPNQRTCSTWNMIIKSLFCFILFLFVHFSSVLFSCSTYQIKWKRLARIRPQNDSTQARISFPHPAIVCIMASTGGSYRASSSSNRSQSNCRCQSISSDGNSLRSLVHFWEFPNYCALFYLVYIFILYIYFIYYYCAFYYLIFL